MRHACRPAPEVLPADEPTLPVSRKILLVALADRLGSMQETPDLFKPSIGNSSPSLQGTDSGAVTDFG